MYLASGVMIYIVSRKRLQLLRDKCYVLEFNSLRASKRQQASGLSGFSIRNLFLGLTRCKSPEWRRKDEKLVEI